MSSSHHEGDLPSDPTHPTGLDTVISEEPGAAIVVGVAAGAKGMHVGVYGSSESNNGVVAQSKTGAALVAIGEPAAQLKGDVEVSGNLKLEGQLQLHGNGEITGPMSLTGPVLLSGGDLTLVGGDIKFEGSADCAEDFTIGTAIGVDPGTVVVLGPEGTLFASHVAYDKRVVGVVSGGGGYKPGIILDRRSSDEKRQPVALLGKVACKVDAYHGPIEVGDLLTTSPRQGTP
jgi:hypothetical protein